MTVFYHFCCTHKSYRDIQTTIREGGEKRILAALQTPIESGALPKKKAIECARAIQSLLTGLLLNYAASDYDIPLHELQRYAVKLAFQIIESSFETKAGL